MASNSMELAKAYVQIIPSAKGIKGSITSVLGGEADIAGNAAGASIASKIKGAIAAAGIGAVLKRAISEGAALEQSYLGGLDTLYGEAADKAREYARAAAEAGISINSYAEQAVSFGAALKQSLGGDVVAASEAANTAILDMADNAAKMGTDIGSIQTAYQGFAKQNYTMLDNLKLGYGGTRSEMERLLADASKLPGAMGKKFDINNLADVYEAIHIIQGDLGLTGVAAKEASETLSGSFAAMKSAALNFMGQLVIGEDIKPALSKLVTSVATFLFDNLVPAIGNIIIALPGVLEGFFGETFPGFLDKGLEVIGSIIDGMSDGIPTMIGAMADILTSLLQSIADYMPQIIEMGVNLIVNLVVGLIKSIPKLIEAAPKLIKSFVDAFIAFDWRDIGRQIINGIIDGIIGAKDALAGAAKNAGKALLDGAKSFLGIHSPSRVFRDEVGKNIMLGITAGISENFPSVAVAMEDITSMGNIDLSPTLYQTNENNNNSVVVAITQMADRVVRALEDKEFRASLSAGEVRRAINSDLMRLGI